MIDGRIGTGPVHKVCYIDAGLMSNVGHHANACRHIVGELRRRGIEVDILVNAACEGGLVHELEAHPAFRHYPYERIAVRKSFLFERASFLADLSEAVENRQYGLFYLNSVFPAQMAAMIRWGQTRFSVADMPPVVMEFGLPSGGGEGSVGNWEQYARHYRSAAGGISDDYLEKFLFFTFDRAASRDYSSLVGFAVGTLPPVYAGGEIRLRSGDEQGRPVVGFLGHQRPEKGYHLIPGVLRLLLEQGVRARFLIHNGDMQDTATARELRALALADARVRFEQRPADHGYWNRLLDDTDICVLPYEPSRYAASVSAVAVEAVSCGLPIVSPTSTTMKALAERYQNNSTAITGWTVEAIADAIIEAVRDFPALAQAACQGAERWVLENGAAAFASRLLAFAESRAPARPSPPARPFEPVQRCVSSIARAKMRLFSN